MKIIIESFFKTKVADTWEKKISFQSILNKTFTYIQMHLIYQTTYILQDLSSMYYTVSLIQNSLLKYIHYSWKLIIQIFMEQYKNIYLFEPFNSKDKLQSDKKKPGQGHPWRLVTYKIITACFQGNLKEINKLKHV